MKNGEGEKISGTEEDEEGEEPQISFACLFGAHEECEGGEPDEIGDYGVRYGWHDCPCACHPKAAPGAAP